MNRVAVIKSTYSQRKVLLYGHGSKRCHTPCTQQHLPSSDLRRNHGTKYALSELCYSNPESLRNVLAVLANCNTSNFSTMFRNSGFCQQQFRFHTTTTRNRCFWTTRRFVPAQLLTLYRWQPLCPLITLTRMHTHRVSMMLEQPSNVVVVRGFSTVNSGASIDSNAATSTSRPVDASKTAVAGGSTNKKATDSSGNVFLDNLGTIFLLFIGSIIGWLVRSYYNGLRKIAVREKLIESSAHADPIELDELRIANTEFTPQVFFQVQQYVLEHTNSASTTADPDENSNPSKTNMAKKTMTYPKFVLLVRTAMKQLKGEAFTIQYGHVLDRVILAALLKYETVHPNKEVASDTEAVDTTFTDTSNRTSLIDKVEKPIEFWFTVLSLALYCAPKERIQALHNVFYQCSDPQESESDCPKISMQNVVQLIGYLQDTCQLVPDAQIIMTNHKYPLQEYVVGTPAQLIDHHLFDHKEDSKDTKGKTTNDANIATGDNITVDMLSDILSSRSVCAWGECYKYKSK
jgi:hypothetical protein